MGIVYCMPFQIMYKFEEEQEFYTCKVTHDQFKNFKKLPIVKECKVINKDKKNIQEYNYEVQKSLNLIVKNESSHIHKLSEIM